MDEQNKPATPYGETTDGTIYTFESPEVVKYLKIFPDVSLEAAIGSVISMHQNGTLHHFMAGEPVNGVETEAKEEMTEEEAEAAAEEANEYDPSEDLPDSGLTDDASDDAEPTAQESV